MARQRKTRDVFEIHVDYGYGHGFEYECAEDTRLEANKRVQEYRANAQFKAIKIKKTREKLPT